MAAVISKAHLLSVQRLSACTGGLTLPPEETPRKELCRALKALKSKQKDREKKLRRTEGRAARQRPTQKIEVLGTQRRKGVELYRLLE